VPHGLTPEGFNPKTLDECREEIGAELRARFGQNIQLTEQSIFGQLRDIFAERESLIWAEAQHVYSSAYPDSAEGAALDDLVALAAVERSAATYSEVTLTLGGTNGTVIPINSVSADEAGERWVHQAAATISGGTATVAARPERTGPVAALAGTITEIVTPVSGWTSVTNALDADTGNDVQSDASLREVFGLTMRAGGGSAAEAIRASILRLDGVTECVIIENESAIDDSDGRPGKSFETVIRGGDDQDIVDTIWFGKPAGIETYGSDSGTATDAVGDPHTINFSRPTERNVWIKLDVEYEAGVLDARRDEIEAEALAAILEYGETFTIGRDVVPFKIIQRIDSDGIEQLSLFAGFAANPISEEPLTIALTELAIFDSSRVTFNRLN
jgi:uncharacterized phage protein gp47/JayE